MEMQIINLERCYAYIYKIIFNLHDRSIEKFKNLKINHIYQLDEKYYYEFYNKHNKKEEFSLDYFLLPEKKLDLKNFDEQVKLFKNQYQNSFETGNIGQFQKNIVSNGIDIFYIICCNFILSNLYKEDYIKQIESPYIYFCRFATNVLKLDFLNNNSMELLNLFINKDKFNNLKNFSKINGEKETLEKLLYSMRFCLHTSIAQNENEKNIKKEKDLLYGSLLTKNIDKIININYFPGNEISENDFLKLYENLIEHFKTKNSADGAYICNCGTYYYIKAPGNFKDKECNKCHKTLNSNSNGFYRVFENEKKMKEFKTQFYQYRINYSLITLGAFYDKYIKPIFQEEKNGILKVSKKNFERNNKKIRKLNQISYRILSFILYSHLLFSEELGYIENCKNYQYDEMSFLDIIDKNWEILENELKKKNIRNIRIFLNLIFKDVIEVIKNRQFISTLEERNDFEDKFNKIIEKKLIEYNEYEKKYLDLNKQYRDLDLITMSNLFNEVNDVSQYSEKSFPFYKYFLYCNYPSLEFLEKKLQLEDNEHFKYPLSYAYIKKDDKFDKILKYLPLFNKFTNEILNCYSFKITRKEAQNRLLKDEVFYKRNTELCDEFINSWNDNFQNLIKINKDGKDKTIEFKRDLSVSYFLLDNFGNDNENFLYLAYMKFIEIQNSILESLLNKLNQNDLFDEIKETIKIPINVSNATKDEIIDFLILNKFKLFNILYSSSFRDISIIQDKVNYRRYRNLEMNLKKIEKNFGLLLEGKRLFNKQNIESVVYLGEEYLHEKNKKDIFNEFSEKYKQKPLDNDKRQFVYDYFNDKLKDNINKCIKIMKDFKVFIFYTTQFIQDLNKYIIEIIKEMPEDFELSNDFNLLFEGSLINLNDFYGVYDFIEKLCFNLIKKEIESNYNKKLSEKQKKKIDKYFESKKDDILITKIILSSAIRKFITRILLYKKIESNIKLQLNINYIWEFDIKNNRKFLDEIKDIEKFGIKESEVFSFYDYLGGDLTNLYDDINKENLKVKKKKHSVLDEENISLSLINLNIDNSNLSDSNDFHIEEIEDNEDVY